MIDPDVKIALAKWDAKEWTCFDVAHSIALQWTDPHAADYDGDGANYNAHSIEDVAAFSRATVACVAEIAKWATLLSTVVPK